MSSSTCSCRRDDAHRIGQAGDAAPGHALQIDAHAETGLRAAIETQGLLARK